MARPEAPVDHSIPELGALAESLRSLRRQTGLTYTELAKESCYSAATLKRAASGKHLPSLAVTVNFTALCMLLGPVPVPEGEGGAEVLALWGAATKAVNAARRAARRSTVLPKPQYVRDEGDLSGALRDAWAWSGRPSTREMEKASKREVPRTTANVISTAHAVPRDFRQYAAYLRVCGITGRALEPWFRAWFKIRGVPSDPQPGFAALKDDADAQAAYVSVHAQATGAATSVAEVLERLVASHDEGKAAAPWQRQLQREVRSARNWLVHDPLCPLVVRNGKSRDGWSQVYLRDEVLRIAKKKQVYPDVGYAKHLFKVSDVMSRCVQSILETGLPQRTPETDHILPVQRLVKTVD
ncbi:helix-turn-helix domain-containing protein [Streptomyces salinarius]|uniref:Helix-turn-helix domain-containing protein n=1 Tax=Streptomyces salinarius TaxID=2762598 RepID=A0ABW8BMT7_9ACTN